MKELREYLEVIWTTVKEPTKYLMPYNNGPYISVITRIEN